MSERSRHQFNYNEGSTTFRKGLETIRVEAMLGKREKPQLFSYKTCLVLAGDNVADPRQIAQAFSEQERSTLVVTFGGGGLAQFARRLQAPVGSEARMNKKLALATEVVNGWRETHLGKLVVAAYGPSQRELAQKLKAHFSESMVQLLTILPAGTEPNESQTQPYLIEDNPGDFLTGKSASQIHEKLKEMEQLEAKEE